MSGPKNWFKRHWILTTLIIFFVLVIAINAFYKSVSKDNLTGNAVQDKQEDVSKEPGTSDEIISVPEENFKDGNGGFELNLGVLKGKVILHTGNCMPTACGPDGCPPSSCFSEGVKRKISIREPKQIDLNTFPFFYNGNSDLIETTESNDSGDFIITLPVGNYSIFIVENGTGYMGVLPSEDINVNEYCGNGNDDYLSCFVQIKRNQTTEISLDIAFASV